MLISYGADLLNSDDITYKKALLNGIIFRDANDALEKGILKSATMVYLINFFYKNPLENHTSDDINKKKALHLMCISNNLQNNMVDNNIPLILHIVTTKGMALAYASRKLQNDRDVVLAAVANNWRALQYATYQDDEVVMAAVIKNWKALEYASDEMKKYKEVVLAAVNQSGLALQYASVEMKEHKEVVLAAVTNYGFALNDASDGLKNNEEVVLAAVKNRGSALFYASPEMKNNLLVLFTATIHSEKNFYVVLAYSDLDITDLTVTELIKEYGKEFVDSINIGDSVYGVLIKFCNKGNDNFELDEEYPYNSNIDALHHYALDKISELDESDKSPRIQKLKQLDPGFSNFLNQEGEAQPLEQLDPGFSNFLNQEGEAQTPSGKYKIKLRF